MLGVSRALEYGLEHGLEHVPEQVFRETQSWPGFVGVEPSPVLGDGQGSERVFAVERRDCPGLPIARVNVKP